eukprot:TRINITY_DN103665_c0_g1_i1.p2 TRINITY_DN103665_c0_g1~~TRINITY_DN103665_c0_g1_i1.p2  ORF type:complete len:155 (-),score=10.52 TRINITY_DN103665_c0_g1_i1:286-750(-)
MTNLKEDLQRRLFWHGAMVFLIGMVACGGGAAAGLLPGRRAAVGGHIQAVLNSLWLICVGVIVPHLNLGTTMLKALFWSLMVGIYPHISAYLLFGYWNVKSQLMPLGTAGAPTDANEFQENVLAAILLGPVTCCMIAGVVMLLLGLSGPKPKSA